MNDDLKKLEERLERATAAGDTLDDTLDAETRSLREGWLALGELIEAAQPPEDASPEITQLWLQYPAQAVPGKEHKPAAWKIPAALTALAASLLVAALATWSLVGGQNDQKIAQGREQYQQRHQPTDMQSAPIIENIQPPVLVKDQQKPGDTTADEFDWDAPLDTEIAAAGQKMLSIKATWYASTDTAGALYYRMQQMQENLGDNTL